MKSNSKPLKPRAKNAPASGGTKAEGRGRAGRETAPLSAFERVLVDISTRFIALPSSRVDSEITLAQKEVCACLGIDVSALWQKDIDYPGSLTTTHIFVPPDFPAQVPTEPMDAKGTFPWSMQKLFEGETIVLSRMADLPPAAARDLELYRYFSLKSALTFPLSAGGGPVFGAVSFNEFRKERAWTTDIIDKLGLVAQIFANALARKRADQALRESEARYRSIFEQAIEGIYRVSLEGKLLLANPAIAKILGYDSAEDFLRSVTDVGRQVWAIPEDRPRGIQLIEKEGALRAYECRFRRKDGTPMWVSLNTTPVRGPDGRIAYFDGFVADIDERKRTDQALQESESRYRSIFEQAIEGIFRTSADGKILMANPALAKMLGYDSAEALLRNITDIRRQVWVNPEERSRFLHELNKQGAIGGYECKLKRKDGATIWVSLSTRPVRGPDGRIAYYEGLAEDITERRQAKMVLAESERRYRTLFESSPLGIIVVGTDGYVRAANSFMARLYGYESPQQLEGFYTPLFLAEKDRERGAQNMRAVLQGKDLGERVYTAVRRDGSEFTVAVTSALLGGTNKDVQGYLCLTRDITKTQQDESERIQLRQELAHLARVMALTELSTSLAHEINQPLGAILNNAEAARSLLSQAKEERREIGEIIEDIIQDAQRAGDVVRKIRGLAKKGEAIFEPLSVNTLIEDVVKLVNNSLIINNITLQLDMKPDLANVRGDRVRLQQVLLNLMTNAIDAMKKTPSRILEVRSAQPATDTVAVSICDSGTGIVVAGKENVFKPFFTTKKDGLGMGLAICQSIIEEHGGRIWGENNQGGGATFSFSLKTWPEKEVLD